MLTVKKNEVSRMPKLVGWMVERFGNGEYEHGFYELVDDGRAISHDIGYARGGKSEVKMHTTPERIIPLFKEEIGLIFERYDCEYDAVCRHKIQIFGFESEVLEMRAKIIRSFSL